MILSVYQHQLMPSKTGGGKPHQGTEAGDQARSPELPSLPGQSVPAAAPHRGLLPVLAAAPAPPGHGTGHGPGQHLAPQALEDRDPHPRNQPPHPGPPGLGVSLPRPLGRTVAKPPGQSRLISRPTVLIPPRLKHPQARRPQNARTCWLSSFRTAAWIRPPGGLCHHPGRRRLSVLFQHHLSPPATGR